MEKKVCKKCGEEKFIGDFYKDNRNKKDGHFSKCKSCMGISRLEKLQREGDIKCDLKTCSKCRKEKSISEFYRKSNNDIDVKSICKVCDKETSMPRRYKWFRLGYSSAKAYREAMVQERRNSSTKVCSICHLEKDKSEFYLHASHTHGLSSECKCCSAEKNKEWRERNKGKLSDYHKEYYKNNKKKWKESKDERRKNNQSKPLPTERVCSNCGELKSISSYAFSKSEYTYSICCKKCSRERDLLREDNLRKQGLCIACKAPKEDTNKNKKYCVACNKNYALKSKEDRVKAKNECIAYLGGSCKRCGVTYDIPDIYDFHHVSDDKEANLGKLLASHRSISKKIIEELHKCTLYCANCHRAIHWELNNRLEENEAVNNEKLLGEVA